MVNPHEEKCAHEKFYGKTTDYTKYLRNFGEMGVVRSIASVREKLEDRGNMYMFLGQAQNHTGSKYHLLNLRTKLIVPSRGFIW